MKSHEYVDKFIRKNKRNLLTFGKLKKAGAAGVQGYLFDRNVLDYLPATLNHTSQLEPILNRFIFESPNKMIVQNLHNPHRYAPYLADIHIVKDKSVSNRLRITVPKSLSDLKDNTVIGWRGEVVIKRAGRQRKSRL